jgi:hypothetical protein
MEYKKIVSKDGSFVMRQDSGQLWFSRDSKSGSSFGSIYGTTCNIYKAETMGGEDLEGIPVHRKILRFAERLDIHRLRIIRTVSKMGKYGWLQTMQYGYISASKFEYLLKQRKVVQGWENEFILLKEKDLEWRNE